MNRFKKYPALLLLVLSPALGWQIGALWEQVKNGEEKNEVQTKTLRSKKIAMHGMDVEEGRHVLTKEEQISELAAYDGGLAIMAYADFGTANPHDDMQRALKADPAVKVAAVAGVLLSWSKQAPREAWAWLLEANRLLALGHIEQAKQWRDKAMAAAPATSGTVDGEAFEWLADADSRLGPVLEAVLNGKYYWIPLERLVRIEIEPPADLRDLVWTPVTLTFTTGGSNVALVPTRYPGVENLSDDRLRMARSTEWKASGDDTWIGCGQKMLVTDRAEYALMDVRLIEFQSAVSDPRQPKLSDDV